jgi:hypothetical protein
MPCSDPIVALLTAFRPLFSSPTWKKVLVLFRGPLLAHGRRTVTAALWQTGQERDLHFSASHQVLNRALVTAEGESPAPLPDPGDLCPGGREAGYGHRRTPGTALGHQDAQTGRLPR